VGIELDRRRQSRISSLTKFHSTQSMKATPVPGKISQSALG
jgi:hypothetical protein